uniref:Uncharacterized protein n=1 Tax=Salix viminalis TaxID=40686 RepID=A0A6N2LXX4_SALVM
MDNQGFFQTSYRHSFCQGTRSQTECRVKNFPPCNLVLHCIVVRTVSNDCSHFHKLSCEVPESCIPESRHRRGKRCGCSLEYQQCSYLLLHKEWQRD